jgi:hypothetical protein
VQRRPPRPEAPTDWLEDKKLWDRGYAATSARGEMVTVAMRDGFAKAQRWEDGTSGLSPEPDCSAFANLPWLLSVLPCLFRDRRRCSAVAGASVIANPTPVALSSAIALADIDPAPTRGGDHTSEDGPAGRGRPMAMITASNKKGPFS